MIKKSLLASVGAISLIAVPAPAYSQSLGDILGGLNPIEALLNLLARLVLGEVAGDLEFANAEQATNRNTCQPRENAERVVNGQIYSEDGSPVTGSDDYVCSEVELKGFKKSESAQIAPEIAKILENKEAVSGTWTTTRSRGRTREYQFSASETYRRDVELDITTIDGIFVPGADSKLVIQDRPFYAVDVRTLLNLRAGPGTNFEVTGKFAKNNIVEVIGVLDGMDDRRKCKSGRWALIASSGAGVGYICTDYIKEAPAGTTRKNVSLAMKPDTVFRAKRTGGGGGARVVNTDASRSGSSSGRQKFQRAVVRGNAPCKTVSSARVKKGKVQKANQNQACYSGGGSIGFIE